MNFAVVAVLMAALIAVASLEVIAVSMLEYEWPDESVNAAILAAVAVVAAYIFGALGSSLF